MKDTNLQSVMEYHRFDRQTIHNQAKEIARLYYEKGMKQVEIARLLGMYPIKVMRRLTYANENRLVSFRIENPSGIFVQPLRNQRLENILNNRFRNLSEVIVVDIPDELEQDNGGRNDSWYKQALGKALAESLIENVYEGDVIGVTGGEIMKYVAESMRLLGQTTGALNQTDVRIVSLVGTPICTPACENFNISCSADFIAATMAAAFKDAPVSQLGVPLVSPDQSGQNIKYPAEERMLFAYWKNNRAYVPNVALLEIEALDRDTHPLGDIDTVGNEPIQDLLEDMWDLHATIGYHAVGSCGQRLFTIDPLPNAPRLDNRLLQLEQVISQINTHLNAPTPEQLKMTDTVVVAVGGEKEAVRTILSNPNKVGKVDWICMDTQTAVAILYG